MGISWLQIVGNIANNYRPDMVSGSLTGPALISELLFALNTLLPVLCVMHPNKGLPV
ncbi:hypothetical protein [Psychrobacter sp. 72-O-c]|uniref:hypothetical protein n=1 Tax=Psychrobacter sp. 72-O-c TaxID=2774125 RepID=UPI001918118D|nr:hypothetical protein [Psychrobacter sp. 72-O-c]